MNELVKAGPAVSDATMESVLGTGDLSELTVKQRVEYYTMVCKTIGVNPLTQPFRFLIFQGKIKLYATRDCADQLRDLRKINLSIVEKSIQDGILMVTARATTQDGRQDEDYGAVAIGNLQGEQRANSFMRAITKAKRRVTLSVCGLGFLDESEVETLRGARTFDAHDPLPVTPIISTEPERDTGRMEPKEDTETDYVDQVSYALANEPNGTKWLALLRAYASRCESYEALEDLQAIESVRKAETDAPSAIRSIISDIWTETHKRLTDNDKTTAPMVGED